MEQSSSVFAHSVNALILSNVPFDFTVLQFLFQKLVPGLIQTRIIRYSIIVFPSQIPDFKGDQMVVPIRYGA